MLRRVVLAAVLGGLIAPASMLAQDEWQGVQGGPDTQCAFGDPLHFYARIAQRDSLLVFFGGGGACLGCSGLENA